MEVLHRLVLFTVVMSVSSRPERRKEGREVRALVPQLLPNYTTPSPPPASSVSCSQAWLSCTYRDGCGLALQRGPAEGALLCAHALPWNLHACAWQLQQTLWPSG